jgi:hypothetical protein
MFSPPPSAGGGACAEPTGAVRDARWAEDGLSSTGSCGGFEAFRACPLSIDILIVGHACLSLVGLHVKDGLKATELEQPREAPRRVDEDKPVPSGCAPATGGQERTKSAQIDESQTGTVDQNVTVHVRQLHLELRGGGQVELSGQ